MSRDFMQENTDILEFVHNAANACIKNSNLQNTVTNAVSQNTAQAGQAIGTAIVGGVSAVGTMTGAGIAALGGVTASASPTLCTVLLATSAVNPVVLGTVIMGGGQSVEFVLF